MSNTHLRIQKRRQYVKKKISSYVLVVVSFLLGGAVLTGFSHFSYRGPIGPLLAVISAVLWSAAVAYVRYSVKTARQVSNLPYVPPVTAENLPVEEVLMRGSAEPAAEQSKVLLRGTQSSEEITENELLRGSAGPSEKQSKLLLRGTDGSVSAGEQELLRGSQGQYVDQRNKDKE
ncbi:MAG TPA: hypothetical protein VKU00_25795 [Chthonomonadaceae bacterium]|nr:hypothetical protein [Chthonomonadaceae bacterium]